MLFLWIPPSKLIGSSSSLQGLAPFAFLSLLRSRDIKSSPITKTRVFFLTPVDGRRIVPGFFTMQHLCCLPLASQRVGDTPSLCVAYLTVGVVCFFWDRTQHFPFVLRLESFGLLVVVFLFSYRSPHSLSLIVCLFLCPACLKSHLVDLSLLFIRFCHEIFSGIFYTVHSLNRVPSFALHLLLDIPPASNSVVLHVAQNTRRYSKIKAIISDRHNRRA